MLQGNFNSRKSTRVVIILNYRDSWPIWILRCCDFWIYVSVSNEMCTDRISYDTNYWVSQLLPIQSQFYLHLVLQFFLGWAMRVNSCDNTEDVILVDTIQTTQNLLFWGLARKTSAPWSTLSVLAREKWLHSTTWPNEEGKPTGCPPVHENRCPRQVTWCSPWH